ncbi:MAG: helix-turn-helix domain-containing protein [Bacteroidales bacterium]|nr:helix-turn-helix domain-containing protein [Bacteroidales bacterium]
MENFVSNERLNLAFDYLFYTGRNVFLTGKAGTGKTTFLKKLRETSPKRMIVTSPTGVAAINAGGVTLHSFFQLPFGPQVPGYNSEPDRAFSKIKIDIIRSLELLVIDEISMVRADLLDSIDSVLRRYRGNKHPFGGVQLLLIGDMQQLSPVVRQEDEEILRPYYDTFYFFGSKAWQQTSYVCIELNQIFRQTDTTYIDILNSIRNGFADEKTLKTLNSRYIPNYQPKDDDDIVTLVTTNAQADRINSLHLLELNTEIKSFSAEITGDFPETSYPIEKNLSFKIDSVVMFIKNDTGSERRFYNGKIGRIVGFEEDTVVVKCKGDSNNIYVKPMKWENTKYTVDKITKEIKEEIVGTFTQIPLKTAWAVTIHKSQGLTFDKMLLDAAHSFAHGQVYVALSRCRTLEGLILLNPLQPSDIISDPTIKNFANIVEEKMPTSDALTEDRRMYFYELVEDMFDFSTLHANLQTLQRAVAEGGSSVIGNTNILNNVDSKIYTEMMTVAEKFIAVIKSKYISCIYPEKEDEIIQRISKGCIYYLDKINTFVTPIINEFAFDCDDKAKAKRIEEALSNFKTTYSIKKGCINALKDRFSISQYLDTKSKLSLTPGTTKQSQTTYTVSTTTTTKNPDLYKILSDWRKKIAKENNVDTKEIITTKTMVAIADAIPSEYKELIKIKGMGGTKGKAFGKQVFDIIIKYRREKGMPVAVNVIEDALFESLSTQEKSLQLIKEGASIDEICKKRNLAKSTIVGHLLKHIEQGEIDPRKLISSEIYDKICMFLAENPKILNLKEIYFALKEQYSYEDIRISIAGFNAENS